MRPQDEDHRGVSSVSWAVTEHCTACPLTRKGTNTSWHMAVKDEGRAYHLPQGHSHSSPLLCHVSRHPPSAAGTSCHTSLQPLNLPCPSSLRCHFAWAPLPTSNYPITICPPPTSTPPWSVAILPAVSLATELREWRCSQASPVPEPQPG